jgi:trans-aconitate methyltransferase
MSTSRRVEAYFTDVAASYNAASKGRVWGLVRRREAAKLLESLGDFRGSDVLELGCGAGYYTRLLLQHGARHVHAVDLSARMIEQLPRDGVTPLVGDATTIDPGRPFKVLVSAGMMEFVPDPRATFVNAARYAEPGAVFAILYPTDTWLGRAYQRFHRRHNLDIALFGAASLARLTHGTGWATAAVTSAGPYSACARFIREGA